MTPVVRVVGNPDRSSALAEDAVRSLLERTEMRFLLGLREVLLVRRASLPSAERQRHQRRAGQSLKGSYFAAHAGVPARIELYLDAIQLDQGVAAGRLRVLRELRLGRVLFHELGHHITRVVEPAHRDREAVAEAWARRLQRAAFDAKYSRYRFLLRPLRALLRLVG